MLLRGFSSILLSSVFFLAATDAAVFERDWKNPGDGLLTFDDVSNREWLDLTETYLSDFPGTDIESHFQSVLAETVSGGLFEGFTSPTSYLEIRALAQSAGIDTGITDPAIINLEPTLNLIDLLGETTPLGGNGERGNITVGYIDELFESPQVPRSRVGNALFHFPGSGRNGESGLRVGLEFSGNIFTTAAGVFLYRNVVPEPATPQAVLFCAALFCCVRKRTQPSTGGD